MPGIIQVISTEIKAARRYVKSRFMGLNDIRSPKQASPYGSDSCPVYDTRMVYVETAKKGAYAVFGCLTNECIAGEGENRQFSTDTTGGFKFHVWLRADGTVLMGDSKDPMTYTNYAVKFNELRIEFNLLKTNYNALVATFNAHTHPYVNVAAPAVTSPTLTPGTTNTSNIDNAKNTKIKTN